MNAPSPPIAEAPPLVDIIQLKWLLAGEGVYLHVERMLSDACYAQRALERAAASALPELRAAAERLRPQLPAAAG